MKKQGFTLIELMVVIVIMGILAAVAVPKLFGMIAKSKASEIGPAAGEYIKLQDAFVSETGTTYGNWKFIGYKMASSNNVFNYVETNSTLTNGTATLGASAEVWKATNISALNDCGANSEWQINILAASSGNGAAYDLTVTGGATGNCNVLVPGFGKLDKDGHI